MKKISLIIPVYNVEKYLRPAMDSAVNQDYENYEVICIDDGSTDNSGTILDSYSEKYANVTVIHKQNTGYGNSMNLGLDIASGDYISILEPDDYISLNTFSSMMKVIEKEGDLDFIKANFSFVSGEDETTEIRPVKVVKNQELYGRIIKGKEILELYKGYIAHWTAIYRKDFLDANNIKYNETPGASYQDIGLWFQTIMYAQNAYLLDQSLYYYRADNPASSVNNPNKVFCTCEEYDSIEKKIENLKNKEEIIPYYVKCRLISVKDTYSRISDQYRKDFLVRAGKDFENIKKIGKLDTSKLSDTEYELLTRLLQSPYDLWKYKKGECNKLKDWIKHVDSFYIYGAGNQGQFVLRLLDDSEKGKLKGFIVTKKNGENEVAGKPVYSFENIRNNLGNSKIVIGVSDLFMREIIDMLERNNLLVYFAFKGGLA